MKLREMATGLLASVLVSCALVACGSPQVPAEGGAAGGSSSGAAPAAASASPAEASGSASASSSASSAQEGQPREAGQARPSTLGALHTKATSLCDENDQPVCLRGVSTHGLAWFPDYVNQEMFDELAAWGANVVRLALYTQESGGWCSDGDRDRLLQLVLDGVSQAKKADLYVIVDWHTLSDNNPNTHLEEATSFFRQVTEQLGDDPHVLYEICNEPNGSTTWPEIKEYAERVIPVIRERAPHAVCLVGTPEWCQHPEQAAADPLDLDNVMYTVHFYAASHGDWLRERVDQALAKSLPIFVSEFGICDASGNGAIDEGEANAWMSFLDERAIGHVMWNLSNKDESSAILRSDCAKVSGIEEGDLSQAGQWLRAMLGGTLESRGEGTSSAPSASAARETASTAVAGTELSYATKLVTSWQEGPDTVFQYEIRVENGGESLEGWSFEIPLSAPATLVHGWNARFSVEGTRLVVTNESYNASLPTGGSVKDIGVQLKGPSDLSLGA